MAMPICQTMAPRQLGACWVLSTVSVAGYGTRWQEKAGKMKKAYPRGTKKKKRLFLESTVEGQAHIAKDRVAFIPPTEKTKGSCIK